VHAASPRRWWVYYGTSGSGLFQQLYRSPDGTLASLSLMPEWYLLLAGLAVMSMLGIAWRPLLLALPVLGVCLVPLFVQALRGAARARFPTPPHSPAQALRLGILTAVLYLAQPVARLAGRLTHGLTPWRKRGRGRPTFPRTRVLELWSEHWRPTESWLGSVEAALRSAGAAVQRGGAMDRWELHVRGGLLGAVRIRLAVEEHGEGRQLARYRVWPRCSGLAVVLLAKLAGLTAAAAVGNAVAATVLAAVSGAFMLRLASECGSATASAIRAIGVPGKPSLENSDAVRSRVVGAGVPR
jgi:hypothetical protein